MTSKTQKHKSIRMLSYTLITCAAMLVCTGCKHDTDTKGGQTKFAIDKDYQRGPLTVHVRLDKAKMSIAETCHLELEAAIKPGFEVHMPEVGKKLKDFGIVDWDNLGDKLDKNNNVVSRYRYRLEPFLSGNFQIPEFTFHFTDVNNSKEKNYELTTEPIDVEVTSLLGEQRAKLVISDIEGVVGMPEKSSYLWILAVGIVGIVAFVGFWYYLRRKRVEEFVRIFKPAHEIAYERLRALVKDDLVKKGKIKEFYEQISNILRHYIEHRFNLRAPERTTEEFLIELSTTDVLGDDDRADLAAFLNLSDLVKFAKYDPNVEQIQETFDLVKKFIDKTKSDEKKIDVSEQIVESGAA